jgi:hypothetical protein
VARHADRELRRLELDAELPAYDAELSYEGRVVGRATSAAQRPDRTSAALAYVRTDVPPSAVLHIDGQPARQL